MELKESKIGKYIVEFRDLLGDKINGPAMKKFPKKIKNELLSYNGRNEDIGIDLGEFIVTYFGGINEVLRVAEGLGEKTTNKLIKVFSNIYDLISNSFDEEP